MKKIVLATVLAALGSASALAADLGPRAYTKAPMMAEAAYSWSGFYLGAQLGGAGSNSRYAFNNSFGVENFSFEPSSFIGGGHAGVQGQWGSWVLGLEGTYNFTDLKQTDQSIVFGPTRLRSNQTPDVTTLVGKIGYASGPWMVYAKGGLAVAKIGTSSNNDVGNNSDSNGWQSGYTIGGGVDYMFAKSWIVGADFNYYDFRFDRSLRTTSGVPVSYNLASNQIYAGTVRLSYLFNWGVPKY
jgi:outer membrane immunogenic protein